MRKICRVLVNGEPFSAYCGDLLLDAALLNGIDLPHDCRSGYCGTCRVRLLEGRVFGGESCDPEMVHACQCRIISDLSVAAEEVPDVATFSGRVSEVAYLAPTVCEVAIELARPRAFLPGQHCWVQFRGFPTRCYSPTVPFQGRGSDGVLRLQVRRVPNGRVSSALGTRISEGHRVKLTGPMGGAYLRPHHSRLVLIASGTGFAPIWAIAEAAMRARPDQELVLVVGARTLGSFYMIPALCRLAAYHNVSIIPVVSEPQNVSDTFRHGRPADHVPPLSARDAVYAAGAPTMVAAVVRMAKIARAKCYADPFDPQWSRARQEGLWSRAAGWLSGAQIPSTVQPSAAPRRPERLRGSAATTGHASLRAGPQRVPLGLERPYATGS
jgi:NAD(P)H-flavin reductase